MKSLELSLRLSLRLIELRLVSLPDVTVSAH